jgi:PKD repeat protein
MKKLLLALLIGLSTQISAQQVGAFQMYVVNQSGTPLSNVPVTVTDYSGGTSTTITSLTNASGLASDSLTIGTTGILTAMAGTAICIDTASMSYTPNNGPWVWFIDTLVLCGTSTAQNNFQISALVLTNNYQNFVPNYPVTVIDSASGPAGGVASHNFMTDATGNFTDSITTVGSSGTLWFLAPDSCGFTTIAIGYAPNSPSTLATAGLVLCNNIVNTGSNCNFAFGASVSQISNFTFGFWHQANSVNTTWDFGDGTTSTLANPTHTYNAPGTYVYCVTVDSCPTVCDSIVIASFPTNCSASFIIDSVNSQPGNVVVWNTSTPAYSPNTTTQYLWDFGDGSTSTQAFPSHTYNGAGTYIICLGVTVPAMPTMPACSSIYCDTLKVDSLGNIIQKSTGASFTLNVLDPNTISIDENDFTTSRIFPNPASDYIQIEIDANSTGDVNIELLSINGAVVNSISSDVNSGLNTLEMNVSEITGGIYFIKISKDGTNHFEKVIIR